MYKNANKRLSKFKYSFYDYVKYSVHNRERRMQPKGTIWKSSMLPLKFSSCHSMIRLIKQIIISVMLPLKIKLLNSVPQKMSGGWEFLNFSHTKKFIRRRLCTATQFAKTLRQRLCIQARSPSSIWYTRRERKETVLLSFSHNKNQIKILLPISFMLMVHSIATIYVKRMWTFVSFLLVSFPLTKIPV